MKYSNIYPKHTYINTILKVKKQNLSYTLIMWICMQRVIALSLTLLGKQWKEVKITQFVNMSSGNWKSNRLLSSCDGFNSFYSF